jgi:hypothetical protein
MLRIVESVTYVESTPGMISSPTSGTIKTPQAPLACTFHSRPRQNESKQAKSPAISIRFDPEKYRTLSGRGKSSRFPELEVV